MAKKIKTKCRFRSLEDLRWLLVRSTLAIVIMAFATYFFDYLFDTIIFGPVRPTFTTYQFCDLSILRING
jgi:sec-independent protein translocase protein TatC